MQSESKAAKKVVFLVTVLAAILIISPVSSQTIPPPTLSNNCAGCHGTYGYSSSPMPIIAGLSKTYLGQVMRQFKNDTRASTIMGRLAKGYTETQIDDMAAFFASQTWKSPFQSVDPALVARGKEIHQEKCQTCHRNGGRFQDDTTPRIAGQWRRYLEIILQEYAKSEREMPDFFMTIITRTLSAQDITALAHFYASKR
jgi:sulfide dehydrogenase cytochrome subunit